MSEDHEIRIKTLMDNLISRLEFEVQSQQPSHLPAITQAVTFLEGFRNGTIKGEEKHIMEITLLKNINNQVKGFNQGGMGNGSNQTRQPEV